MTPYRFVDRTAAEAHLKTSGFIAEPDDERWVKVVDGMTFFADLMDDHGAVRILFSYSRASPVD